MENENMKVYIIRYAIFVGCLCFGLYSVGASAQYVAPTNPFGAGVVRAFLLGDVKIRNRNWGKCLNLRSHFNREGGHPDVFGCLTHTDQEWVLSIVGSSPQQDRGTVTLSNKSWGKCLMLSSAEAFNGGVLSAGNCSNSANQQWLVEPVGMVQTADGPRTGTGWFKLRNVGHGLCLNLQSWGAHEGGLPNVWGCASHADQEWFIMHTNEVWPD